MNNQRICPRCGQLYCTCRRKIIDARDPNCPHSVQEANEGDLLILGTTYDPDYAICRLQTGAQMRCERISAKEFEKLAAAIPPAVPAEPEPPREQRPFPYAHLMPKKRGEPLTLAQWKPLAQQALAELGIQPNQPRQLVDNPELTVALRRMQYYDGKLAAVRQAKGEEVW
ncbi:MAG: hypothetical protein H6658_02240 [Ardenticatenaceae bacterium]|nr:hypothetical protein [Ardenticatenaceae bacterium]